MVGTWIIPVSKWLVTPPFINHLGDLEGEQPYLGDLQSPWLLTTYESWDDPPRNPLIKALFLGEGVIGGGHLGFA